MPLAKPHLKYYTPYFVEVPVIHLTPQYMIKEYIFCITWVVIFYITVKLIRQVHQSYLTNGSREMIVEKQSW